MEDVELIGNNENSKEDMNTECNSKASRLSTSQKTRTSLVYLVL